MKKNGILVFVLSLFLITTVGDLYAGSVQKVLKTDMQDASRVVGTRKFLMQAVKGNIIDLSKKLKAGMVKETAANGISIAAIAAVMPPLFKDAHKKSYPFEGSKTFFKGPAPAAFEAASDKMRVAGMEIKKAAEKGDQAGVKSGLEALKSSCGGCHSSFRGKY